MDTTLNKENTLGTAWGRFVAALHGAMDARTVAAWGIGQAQTSGTMTVVPIFGAQHTGFAAPGAGVRLKQVHTYGDVELECPGDAEGLAIVPLHMGFVQHGAQNHALCGSALIEPGKSVRFKDARCVQAAQGGLLEGRDQWFFVLPLGLRVAALDQIGHNGYNQLWGAIEELNASFGLPKRGHLEQILTKQRAVLTQFRSRFECMDGQTGALFFVGDRLAGVEIAPSSVYFRDIWMPLAAFAYGVAAHGIERSGAKGLYGTGEPFTAIASLADLRDALRDARAEREDTLATIISASSAGLAGAKRTAVARHGKTATTLETVKASGFAGQVVKRDGEPVYVSLFRTR
ncbi:MAG: hypothetical protein H8F28_13790 [Fibrella sp.]|nr:hypothetical protein [Armatimonadota bacterium]